MFAIEAAMRIFIRYTLLSLVFLPAQSIAMARIPANPSKVTCKSAIYPITQQRLPTTFIQSTTGNSIPFIYWIKEVAGENPEKRCKEVSKVIEARFDDQTWSRHYLRTGKSKDGYPVICYVDKPKDSTCDPDRDLVVKLKRSADAGDTLDKMLATRYRTYLILSFSFQFYFGEIHRERYIDINGFVQQLEEAMYNK
jgi:hypothetical protein